MVFGTILFQIIAYRRLRHHQYATGTTATATANAIIEMMIAYDGVSFEGNCAGDRVGFAGLVVETPLDVVAVVVRNVIVVGLGDGYGRAVGPGVAGAPVVG